MNWTTSFKKAVTFSYDDGVLADIRLKEMFDRYGLKCTFNVNTGQYHEGLIKLEDMKETYKGHEVAVHTLTHPDLTKVSKEELIRQIGGDKLNIEAALNIQVVGMAYPFGTFNDEVVDVVKSIGIKYARTIIHSYNFKLQEDLLRFKPTCHHNDETVFDLIDVFLSSEEETPQILYIWGHSYEFDRDDTWDRMEKICQLLSNHSDIFYGTNKEVLL